MGVKLAVALGAQVTVFSTSKEKEADAKRFGAAEFVLSTDTAAMQNLELKFDFLLNTIPYEHDPNPYIKLLKRDGTMATVGLVLPYSKAFNNQEMIMHRRNLAASVVGGVPETEELLQFCHAHNILPEVEMISIADINDAHKRMKNGEARYRYVIDVANTLGTPQA